MLVSGGKAAQQHSPKEVRGGNRSCWLCSLCMCAATKRGPHMQQPGPRPERGLTAPTPHLLVLQVPQGPGKAEGGAVEEAPPQLEGEQEAAVPRQRSRPGRQVAAADGQHILRRASAGHGAAVQALCHGCWSGWGCCDLASVRT